MLFKKIVILTLITLFMVNNLMVYAQENSLNELKLYCETIAIEDAIGQLFIVGLPEVDYTTYKDKDIVDILINDYKIGGVMLNTYNFYINNNVYDNRGQEYYLSEITDMINYLQYKAIKSDIGIPLLTCVDFESNYASISKGVKTPPSALTMGHANNTEHLETVGKMVGNELSGIGINVILGPVLDTPENVNGKYDVTLSNRYFTNRPDMTYVIASHYLKGLHEGNLMVIAKHFPGYCDLSGNPHTGVPEFSGNMDTLIKNIEIYKKLNNQYDGVMSANYYLKDSSYDEPIMLNPDLKTYLARRNITANNEKKEGELDLTNKLVITDDLSNMEIVEKYMNAKGCTYSEVAIKAFTAGHDMILFSHLGKYGGIGNFDLDDFRKVVDEMTEYIKSNKNAEREFRESLYRILSLKNRYDGRQSSSNPEFKKPWHVIKNKNIGEYRSKSHGDSEELIIKLIEDSAVLINSKNNVRIDNGEVLIVGTNPEEIINGIKGLTKNIEFIKVDKHYSRYNDINKVVKSIKDKLNNNNILLFIVDGIDHATILEILYLDNVITKDNVIILNHHNPTIFNNKILKDITVFNTMSDIKESYEIDKIFLVDNNKVWNSKFRINLGVNKSYNDVLQYDFKIKPSEGGETIAIFSTNNEQKLNTELVKEKEINFELKRENKILVSTLTSRNLQLKIQNIIILIFTIIAAIRCYICREAIKNRLLTVIAVIKPIFSKISNIFGRFMDFTDSLDKFRKFIMFIIFIVSFIVWIYKIG